MKMPHVIPDLIRNPGINDWIPAPGSGSGTGYAGITMYFHMKVMLLLKSITPIADSLEIPCDITPEMVEK